MIFFLVVFYLKTFDETMGTKVATWLAPVAVVSDVNSGAQDPVLSGLQTVQTSLDAMTQKMNDIATKLGIVPAVVSGTEIVAPVAVSGTIAPVKTK
ncbi:MAG: hypothetical protein NTX91_04890 [candidate division SR1 bacterium]|nr:hypothetical protein [candidate division SR1 bacterium]